MEKAHHHTFRRYTPELWDAVSALRVVTRALWEITRLIDPERSSKNDDQGTDPEGAKKLSDMAEALEGVAYDLSKMTGENYIARLETDYEVDESDDLPPLVQKAVDLWNDDEVPEKVKVYLKKIIEDSGWTIEEIEVEETKETTKGATVIEFPHD
jgi:hypothetical protein